MKVKDFRSLIKNVPDDSNIVFVDKNGTGYEPISDQQITTERPGSVFIYIQYPWENDQKIV